GSVCLILAQDGEAGKQCGCASDSLPFQPNAKAKLPGPPAKNIDARKTKRAAPVSFSRWFGAFRLPSYPSTLYERGLAFGSCPAANILNKSKLVLSSSASFSSCSWTKYIGKTTWERFGVTIPKWSPPSSVATHHSQPKC